MSLNIKAKNTSYTLLDKNDSSKFVLLKSDSNADKSVQTLYLPSDINTYDILLLQLGFTDSGYDNKIVGFCNFIPVNQFINLPSGPGESDTSKSIPFLVCEYYSWDFKDRYSVKLFKNTNEVINIKTSYSTIKYYIYGIKF